MERITQLDSANRNELAELNMQLVEDEGHSNLMGIPELANRMDSWLSSEYTCYGVCDDEKILSYCLFRDDHDYFYIRQLFTVRHLRGKGLATKLLDYLESTVLKGKPIRIEVLVSNIQAKEFYLARGFNMYCHTLEKND